MHERIAHIGIDHPRAVGTVFAAVCAVFILLVALPSIWPQIFPMLHPVAVDTDPENMLREDEPVRIFHDRMKHEFSLYDMIVVGVVDETAADGVFNPDALGRIRELTQFARTLRWPADDDPARHEGVVAADIIAPSLVDNIEQAGEGSVRFEWLMPEPPADHAASVAVRTRAARIPLFQGTMVAESGRALALYLPLTSKDASYRVYRALQKKIAEFEGPEQYFITGLPVAEDTFGVEMFIQMGISAPLAMLVIFLLMLYFFRRAALIVAPMLIALGAVVITMGLLVATGNTLHIMSSMIPIFIMPIAVLDSIHVLSEFFDRYPDSRDRRATLEAVLKSLFVPMLYTSITSCAGFISLVLTPIPPVQVFGLFVAFGIATAWVLTIAFVPAYIMMLPERALEGFGAASHDELEAPPSGLARGLLALGSVAVRRAKPIVIATVAACVVAAWGISLVEINDNPIRWFTEDHEIRVADRVLNQHFAGTYMAYLALETVDEAVSPEAFARGLVSRAAKKGASLSETLPEAASVFEKLASEASRTAERVPDVDALLTELDSFASTGYDAAANWTEADAWDAAALFVGEERTRREVFKQPEVLRYVERLSRYLEENEVVGKTNALPDIVKTVYRELLLGKDENFRIPDRADAVAQTLITYQNSHRPQDLWHFVTPDFRKSVLWLQLNSGDNRDMTRVIEHARRFFDENPPPVPMDPQWFGLTYINVVWQQKMVAGMANAFLGSFVVVFLTMTLLFRSPFWGALSMIPLTVTIALIYGVIGLVGKDYDMPVAVLSSLTLGLAIDFAIHFLARSRDLHREGSTWAQTVARVFGEPARAIARNVIVIALGFSPLLVAPLVPYRTVGILMASILVVSGVATLVILPALMALGERWLFPAASAAQTTQESA
ncbi:MAG: MMPL family transporter [bacterium]|nr:MMPL family transporter [bacterium]